jgi:hypothetical protein
VLAADGHVHRVEDRYLPAVTPTPPPAELPARGPAAFATAVRHASRRPARHEITVVSRLAQLAARHQITAAQHRRYLTEFESALRTVKRLRGTRAAELEAVVETLHGIAARGQLWPSRLPELFLTLQRNIQWWTTGTLLSSGQRVEFAGSQLVWEYYPGQGIQLQVLGTFGRADGMFTAGPGQYADLTALLSEMLPLAVVRAYGLTWEYDFRFDGGSPPWVSAMAQGTALEALTRAYRATGQASWLALAHRALPLLQKPPPAGVAVHAGHGTRFLQYSFAPHTDIINAFLQTLIGLHDYARASGDAVAQRLFAAGDAQARAELPSFDTGAWSLYQPGVEDDLSYHELVTGFLQQLCASTAGPVYCQTAQRFQSYLKTPPSLTQLTVRGPAKHRFPLRFSLSKVSHVGVIVQHGASTLLATSAGFSHGVHAFTLPALRPGSYTVRLGATDLAGNFSRVVGTLAVTRRK